jgi:hypothetical protein
MPNRVAHWLVCHHPKWWRRRYQDEVLALLDQDPPGIKAQFDLAWSCAEAWGGCQLSVGTARSSLLVRWLLAVRLAVQVPLAVVVLVFVAAVVLCGGIALLTGALPPLSIWLVVGPVGASGSIAVITALGDRWRDRSVLVSLAVPAAAMGAVLVPFGAIAISDFAVRDLPIGPLSHPGPVRVPVDLLLAYALAAGLVVREVFRGLPLHRCVVNCIHDVPATAQERPS